jgi:omega-6 fatty acid desaturase (delta-12 desaturase)
MNSTGKSTRTKSAGSTLRSATTKYQTSSTWRSTWQVVNTFVPYFALLYVMYRSLEFSPWLALLLAPIAGGLLMRVFIIFHDCGHGSFFKSQLANDILGSVCGVLTFTPYYQWRHDHAVHHATAGDLDRRGVGDVTTLTVAEYLKMSRWERLKYRVFRQPLVMMTVGPVYVFLFWQRFALSHSRKRERHSVYWTNMAILLVIIVSWLTVGIKAYLIVQLPVALIAATLGVALFYFQHQFEDTYWEHHEQWDYETAALKGSSYFKMSKPMQWFTGNIGLHHIHHLNSRIPNYYLQACYDENPRFQEAYTITFRSCLPFLVLKLWDEEQRKLVGFGQLKAIRLREELRRLLETADLPHPSVGLD